MRPTPHSESVRQGEAQNTFREHLTNLRAAEMSRARKQQIVANYGQVPLSFEPNRGKTNPQERFFSRSRGYSLFLTDNEAVLALGGSGQNPKVERATRPKQNSELNTRRPSIEDFKTRDDLIPSSSALRAVVGSQSVATSGDGPDSTGKGGLLNDLWRYVP
jgi:hypothetical protein